VELSGGGRTLFAQQSHVKVQEIAVCATFCAYETDLRFDAGVVIVRLDSDRFQAGRSGLWVLWRFR